MSYILYNAVLCICYLSPLPHGPAQTCTELKLKPLGLSGLAKQAWPPAASSACDMEISLRFVSVAQNFEETSRIDQNRIFSCLSIRAPRLEGEGRRGLTVAGSLSQTLLLQLLAHAHALPSWHTHRPFISIKPFSTSCHGRSGKTSERL